MRFPVHKAEGDKWPPTTSQPGRSGSPGPPLPRASPCARPQAGPWACSSCLAKNGKQLVLVSCLVLPLPSLFSPFLISCLSAFLPWLPWGRAQRLPKIGLGRVTHCVTTGSPCTSLSFCSFTFKMKTLDSYQCFHNLSHFHHIYTIFKMFFNPLRCTITL